MWTKKQQRRAFIIAMAAGFGPPTAFLLVLLLLKVTGWTFLSFPRFGLRPCYGVEAYEDPPNGNDPIHPMTYFDADYRQSHKFAELHDYRAVMDYLAKHAYANGVLIYWPSSEPAGSAGVVVFMTSSYEPGK
jgi:hypothetical protein